MLGYDSILRFSILFIYCDFLGLLFDFFLYFFVHLQRPFSTAVNSVTSFLSLCSLSSIVLSVPQFLPSTSTFFSSYSCVSLSSLFVAHASVCRHPLYIFLTSTPPFPYPHSYCPSIFLCHVTRCSCITLCFFSCIPNVRTVFKCSCIFPV